MPADPLAFEPVGDLPDRGRALRRATAFAIADARVTFARVLPMRAALSVQIADLRWADGCRARA
jgi:hypothetical protein